MSKPGWTQWNRWLLSIAAVLFLSSFTGLPQLLSLDSWATDPTPYQQAVMAYHRGEYAQALVLFRQAKVQEPNNANVRYYLAICLERLARPAEAAVHYQYVAEHSQDTQVVNFSKYRLKRLHEVSPLVASTRISSPRIASVETLSPVPRPVAQVAIVPLKSNTQALMVEAVLDGNVQGTFILDTGATYTSISREMADAMGLDLENAPKVRITTANGRIDVPKVRIKTLSVNGLEAHDVEATVIDVRKGSSFSGLLGLSFIKKFKLTIDSEAGQLIFQPI